MSSSGHSSVEPRVTVGLLTWNPGAEAVEAVAALLGQDETGFEMAWVDNGSRAEAIAPLRERFGDALKPVVNARNVGFCAGHNQLIAGCRTPFYLALNQDAVLPPGYLRRLCDWLAAEPRLALASGVMLQAEQPGLIQSAGLVYPRNRFSFMLGRGRPVGALRGGRRVASGVMGPAMLLRLAACREVSAPAEQIFPDDFFAYHEELDLAQRLGRAGWLCGVDEALHVRHAEHSSGGRRQAFIQRKFLANHWRLLARHEGLAGLLRGLPWIAWGELRWWGGHYLDAPGAVLPALGDFARHWPADRRFYHEFERRHGPTQARLLDLRRLAARELAEFNTRA